MTDSEKNQLFEQVLTKLGIINQVFMVMEECGELLNVLAKAKRGRASKEEIITELADVFYHGRTDGLLLWRKGLSH